MPDDFLDTLGAICEVVTDEDAVAESSRDWWPLALHWSIAGEVPQLADAVVRPSTTEQVAAVARACSIARVPLTVAGGRSGVCGAAIPVFGGVVLDTTALVGVGVGRSSLRHRRGLGRHVRPRSRTGRSRTTTGCRSVTSRRASTSPPSVGGSHPEAPVSTRPATARSKTWWSASRRCSPTARSSHRGRTGRRRRPGPHPADPRVGGHAGDHHQGLAAHPSRAARRAPGGLLFGSFAAGVEACRLVMRAGATPAVLRLYDAEESARGRGGDGTDCLLLVLDEGDQVDRRRHDGGGRPARARRRAGRTPMPALVAAWLEHRNDTTALQGLTRKGFVVDTMEIAAPWSALDDLFERGARRAPRRADGARRHLPPVAQLLRRRLPLLHVRRHSPGRRGRVDLHRDVGRRPACRARRPAATCRTITASV